MAGDWIKMRCCLPAEPEVIAIAGTLSIDEDSVVGKLLRVWAWADQHTTDGNARGVTAAWLDRHVQRDGFASALVKVGWLEIHEDGIRFPRFEMHNLETGKARALNAKRQKRSRDRHNADSNWCNNADSVTPASYEALPTGQRQKRREIETVTETETTKEEEKGGSASAELVELPEYEFDQLKGRELTPGQVTRAIDRVVEHYKTHHPRSRPGTKERGEIAERLNDDYRVLDLCAAIDGMHEHPHNLGDNDNGTPYLSLELCMRTSSQVHRFIETHENFINGERIITKSEDPRGNQRFLAKYIADLKRENPDPSVIEGEFERVKSEVDGLSWSSPNDANGSARA